MNCAWCGEPLKFNPQKGLVHRDDKQNIICLKAKERFHNMSNPIIQPHISKLSLKDKTMVIETDVSKMFLSFDEAKALATRIIQLLEK